MRLTAIAFGVLSSAVAQPVPREASGVLEEIIVIATRIETNLQQTPMSVHALTAEDLEIASIDTGRELGMLVPNVVIHPGPGSESQTSMVIRGLPGVGVYVDGFFVHSAYFLQRNFVDLQRVEVLRGPQGTHFGRNTNGGAVQLVTRPPGDDFRARFNAGVGDFDRRTVNVSVDAPVANRLRTKWTAVHDENDGFLESQTAPFSRGAHDYTLFRADILWEPTDAFSLRFVASRADRESSEARVLRISDPENPTYIAYNVLAGNPDFLAAAREIDPSFPDPPFALAGDRFTAESHEPGFPGGSLDRWQTRTDISGPTLDEEEQHAMLTMNWDVTDRFSLKSLTSYLAAEGLTISDWDASEFSQATALNRAEGDTWSQELQLAGEHFNGRLQSRIGLYYLSAEGWSRGSEWWFWEFAIPNTGPNPGSPGPPGVDGRPSFNQAAVDYVRAWGALAGNAEVANFFPVTFLTVDGLQFYHDTERALFSEVTAGLTDQLDLTLGFRLTQGGGTEVTRYLPSDSFRRLEPGTVPDGDPFAAAARLSRVAVPDTGTVVTPRVSIAYQPTDESYIYASYAEGFTGSAVVLHPFTREPIALDPEVVTTREIGLRSDWLNDRLRFNATYFDSLWDGLRVPRTLDDPDNPGQPTAVSIPTSDGLAETEGLELELSYVPGARWEVDLAIGLLDSEYLEIGDVPANGTGLQPGIPLANAPELSYSFGLRYRLPLASGSRMLFAGNYGWMDEYQRVAPNEYQRKNADGTNDPEPAYGLLSARVTWESPGADWRLSLFGRNLTNQWYVNGGLDVGFAWGYDVATIGRPREIGLEFQYVLD